MEFTGIGLQGPNDESWGLDNVSVSVSEKAVAVALPRTLEEGLVAYYPLNENAKDFSGNNLNGTVSGAVLTTDRFGREDSAYYFDGVDDLISVVDDEGLLNFGSSDFSLTAWVQTESKESHRYVVAKYKQNEFFGYGLGVTFQVPFAFIADTDSELAFIQSIASALPENSVAGKEWHLLSVTYDRSGPQRVYLDHRLVVASDIRAESGAVENLQPLTIGAQSGGYHFEGKIDDVRVYDRELSAEEVALLYDLEKTDVSDLTFDSSGDTVTVTDCRTSAAGKLEIPSVFEGKPVTSIGDFAFQLCRNLTEVIIPDSITNIGQGAFSSCKGLKAVSIPDSVVELRIRVFEYCDNMESVTLGGRLTSIGGSAFHSCSKLKSITIPDSVELIAGTAFIACVDLEEVKFGSSVKRIGDWAFSLCRSLKEVVLPDSLEELAHDAFSSCTSLQSLDLGSGVTLVGDLAFQNCSSLTAVEIPSQITSLGAEAFADCENLIRVDFEGDAPTVEQNAFKGLPELARAYVRLEATGFGDTIGGLRVNVVKLSQSIQWNVVDQGVLGDGAVHVQTEASSGLPVTVELVEGSAILVLEALKPLEGGTITLRATQAGDDTYAPAPEVFHSIEVSLRPEIAQSEGGNVIRVPALDVFTLNQELSLRAVPEDGFAFEGWQGDISSTDNPLTLTVSDNVSVLATFKPLWPLFLEQVEGGRILTNPEQSEFIEGSIVSVLGIADEGYRFDRWLGSLSGNESAATLIIDEAKSVSAVFVEHRAPEIASELSVERVKVGDDFVLEAVVTGTAPLSFQWLKDGASLPGATSATLSISAVQPDDSGIYSLFVTNDAGNVKKDLLDLGVLQPLVLVNQPGEVVQMAQSSVALEVETSGDGPLAYQWSKDGESLGFSPVSALTFESLSESDAGLYSVEITSPVSMVTSEPIKLTVTPFVEAPAITKELQPQSVAIGASLFLTVANSGQPPFTYTWSRDGVETVSTKDPFLLLPNAQSEQSGLYSLAISNPGGEATSGPVEIRILPRAVIASQPEDVQIMQTRPFTLSVTVEGDGELSYQWFKDGEEVVDATSNVYSVAEADFGQTGLYKVVIDSELGPIESDIVSVLVTPLIFAPEIIAGPRSQKVDLGESVSLTVVVGGTEPFEFTWFHEGTAIDGENGPFLIIDAVAEGDLGNYTVEVKNGQGSVLFSDGALLSLRQPVVITSEPDDQRVILGASLRLEFEIEGDPPFTIHWEKDGEIVADASEAMLEIASVSELDAGAYQLVIAERGKEIRSRLIEVEIIVPPTIVSQPQDLELVEGQDIEIVLQANGTLPMTFRLLKGDERVQENETGVFTLASVGPVLSGQYAIEVENEAGAAITDPFDLVLTTAPPVILSQSTSILTTPGERLELSINATGGGISYRWFKDGALLDGETGPQLIVDSAKSETAGEYFAVLTNSRGAITSDPISVSLSSRLRIERSGGLLTIEIIGGSGGEVWNIERSSNLVDWELVEKVVLEMNDGFASGVLRVGASNDQTGFYRATRPQTRTER
ncbi:leucine-rich repeat protein [Verrucomicrobia bacterium]|nr:leucine-rich repeat protein [Verrucomicrobiota bacterium]